jgi:hypothetical protein
MRQKNEKKSAEKPSDGVDTEELVDAILEDLDDEEVEEAAREAVAARVGKMGKKQREDMYHDLVVQPDNRNDVVITALMRMAESMGKTDDYLPEGWTKKEVQAFLKDFESGKFCVEECDED